MGKLFVSELIPREELKKVMKETGAGLETIRFSMSDSLDHIEQNYREFEEDLDYWDHPALSFHGPFVDLVPVSYDSKIQAVTMERFNEGYRAAAHFGAENIVFHSGMVPDIYLTIGWAERIIDFWHAFMKDKTGVTVLMENMLDREIHPFEDVMKDEILGKMPNFGICLDIGHVHCRSPYAVAEWIDKLGPAIKHVHLHNNFGSQDTHNALDDGTLPVETVMSLLRDLPGERTWTIECASYERIMRSFDVWQHYIG
ncbi:MAG: TIM barrel protein [Lachnospiraceae bacterium]|nr:TIM barrel protein [Lachnospiraceae bacterium]